MKSKSDEEVQNAAVLESETPHEIATHEDKTALERDVDHTVTPAAEVKDKDVKTALASKARVRATGMPACWRRACRVPGHRSPGGDAVSSFLFFLFTSSVFAPSSCILNILYLFNQ